nr:MAG TPA: hypothetical protein [Bacteriophage sp.]
MVLKAVQRNRRNKYNLSFVQTIILFNTVVKKLGYTPINEL